LIAAVRGLDGVTVNDLYEAYPEFDVDVAREQRLLEQHEITIFQHPFYWYSMPAILKQWQDLVLEHGWAYGRDGHALEGKLLLIATTTGGGGEAYDEAGANRFTVRQLLAPIEQTARLCGMDFLPPFVVHGTHRLSEADIEGHAAEYRRAVEALRDDRIDLDAARSMPRLNSDLDRTIGS
jgi:glutathione-regulated potassium-efflux system ancillary protein KefG